MSNIAIVATAALAVVSVDAGEQVFDGRCVLQAMQADPERCSLEDPCRGDCWSSIFTHSYCCVADSPCWQWGQVAPGPLLRQDAARSGVECRYLCQAEPACTEWTFQIPEDTLGPDSFAPCTLHSAGEAERSDLNLWLAESAAVSGQRVCKAHVDNVLGPGGAIEVSPVAEPVADTLESLTWRSHVVDAANTNAAEHTVAALLHSGFAVLRAAVPDDVTAALAAAVNLAAEDLLRLDPPRLGNRGPRRYSFGGASKTHHMVHVEEWSRLMDLVVLRPILQLAFNGSYVAVGGGGDFVLGQTDTHQRLHVDLQLPDMYSRHMLAAIVANVAISHVTCQDGPMRIVPQTQRLPLVVAEEASQGEELLRLSSLEKEPILRRRLGLTSVLTCPLRRGDVLLRDMRVWHGGTPNLGNSTRFLPSAEFLSNWYAALTAGTEDHFEPRPALPFKHWAAMSEHGRQVSQSVLSIPGPVAAGFKVPFALMLPYVAEDRP